ncbi:class I SAM-dependent methyltransferase, partial [Pirellulales bacterium]|nr:class I SAM-dependent methyltransferase [Pirellulales bacterium]
YLPTTPRKPRVRKSIAHEVAPTVTSCYDVLDLCRGCDISDFTDGKYIDQRNDRHAYLGAQARQAEFLLDQIDCRRGARILEIGCGYGRILEAAERRGAEAVGITISRPQVKANRAAGREVYLCNYRDIFRSNAYDDWAGAFDGIVANGSLEHFVQAVDAAAGRADLRYEELFDICRRLLKPGGKLVTTAIHARREGQVHPQDVMRSPGTFPKGSDEFHAANLHRSFGGWFPEPGQLENCAAECFELIAEEDGTHDYYLTSEYWLRQLRRSLIGNPRGWRSLAGSLARHPKATFQMLKCLLWDQSWNYQFRQQNGEPAPTQLLRQTWQAAR